MHRQAWVAVLAALTLALAACGDQSEPDTPPPDAPTPPAQSSAAATEEPEPDGAEMDFNVYTPGLHLRAGLTLLRSTEHAAGDTGAFFAELRNDTGALLRAVDGSIDLLDAEGLRLEAVPLHVLLSDIPPGERFFVGETYALPAGYAASAVWLDYTTAETPSLAAYFDLPVTIEAHGPGETLPYTARGTLDNTTGQDLALWALTLAALDADGQIIGLSHAVVTPGAPGQGWPAGTAATFEATFGALAGDPSAVASHEASAVGYALLN